MHAHEHMYTIFIYKTDYTHSKCNGGSQQEMRRCSVLFKPNNFQSLLVRGFRLEYL